MLMKEFRFQKNILILICSLYDENFSRENGWKTLFAGEVVKGVRWFWLT